MSKYTDEWIIAEIVCELKDALKLGRTPTIFVGSREEEDRLKRLLPIARDRFKKSGSD